MFLTGQAEIERACQEAFERAEKIDYRHDVQCHDVCGLLILPVFGALTTAKQRRVFEPPPVGVRKVIFATDIASTRCDRPRRGAGRAAYAPARGA